MNRNDENLILKKDENDWKLKKAPYPIQLLILT